MKNVLLFALLAGAVHAHSEIDLSQFHNVNFNPSSFACGVHIEVSDNFVSFTNIIPTDKENLLDHCTEDLYEICAGQTFVEKCSSDGQCRSRLGGKVNTILLKDGNFVDIPNNRKFHQAGPARRYGQHFYCSKNN